MAATAATLNLLKMSSGDIYLKMSGGVTFNHFSGAHQICFSKFLNSSLSFVVTSHSNLVYFSPVQFSLL